MEGMASPWIAQGMHISQDTLILQTSGRHLPIRELMEEVAIPLSPSLAHQAQASSIPHTLGEVVKIEVIASPWIAQAQPMSQGILILQTSRRHLPIRELMGEVAIPLSPSLAHQAQASSTPHTLGEVALITAMA